MGPKDRKNKTEEVAVEEPQVDNKKAKKGKIPEPVKKAVNGDKKAVTKKPVESDSDDTSDDDTSSEEDTKKTAAKKTVAPVKAAVPQKAAATKKAAETSSSEEDSSDEEETAVAGKRKAQPLTTQEKKVQPITKKAKAESSEESSDDSDEDEKPVRKVEAKKAETKKPEPKKPEVKKVAAKGKQESSEDDSEEESSEEETKKTTTKAQPAKVATKKQESSEDDDEEDEEEEKEQKQPQAKATNNTQMRDVEGSGKTELYVANLSYGTTEDHLYEFFGTYGEVVNVKLLKNPQGQSKGTAFVEFGSSEEASKALASNGEDLQGRQIRVNFSGERTQGAPGGDGFQGGRQGGYQGGNQQSFNSGPRNDAATIFVGNLPFRASVDSIKEYFSQIGEVKDVRLAKDETGKLRGFGHVEFAAESSVDGAIGLNGQSFEGRDLKVDRSNSKGGSGGRGGFGGGRGGFGGGRGGFGGGRGGFGGGRGGFGGGRGRGGFGGRPNIDSDRQSAQKGTIADFQGTKMKF